MKLVWLAGFFGTPLLLHAAVVRQSSLLMTVFALVVLGLFFTRGHVPAVVVLVMALGSAAFGALSWFDVGASAGLALITQSATYLLVAWFFGRTLRAGRTPLVEQMAAYEHGGTLPAELVPYTRRITSMWAILMAAMALTSMLLGWLASQAAWSWFTNVISWLLIAGGFFGEYAYRLRRWPNYRHSDPFTTVVNIVRRAPLYFGPQPQQPQQPQQDGRR